MLRFLLGMDAHLTPVIRYWDYEAHEMMQVLQEAKLSGASTVGAFVPWSLLELDRKQLLARFLKQAYHFKLMPRVILSPEPAIGYPNSGIPIDLMRKKENLAQDRTGQTIFSCAPPNIHPLINLVAPEVFQRYGHFLLKFSQNLLELLSENFVESVELVIGDSFFKHYKNYGLPASDHGDFSSLYFQSELDSIRGWTPAQSERTFRVRAIDFLTNRFNRFDEVKISNRSFFARSVSLDRLMENMYAAAPDCASLFQEMKQASGHMDSVWLDNLQKLSARERSFTISSALSLYGDVWLNLEDYQVLSQNFRKKMHNLGKQFLHAEMQKDRPVLSIVQNRFTPARLSSELKKQLGTALRYQSYLSDVDQEDLKKLRLLVVEEALAISHDQFRSLLDKAKKDRCTIALFRSSLCKKALQEFGALNNFRISHGWKYEISIFENGGHFIVIDGHEASISTMNVLASRLLAVADVEEWCVQNGEKVNNSSLDSTKAEDESNTKLLFLYNEKDAEKEIDLHFMPGARLAGVNVDPENSKTAVLGQHFQSSIPALSVVPLLVNWPKNLKERPKQAEESKDGDSPQLA